jgi:hypothetical protein
MYQFILNLWVFDKLKTEAEVYNLSAKGYITQEEASRIVATPKAPQPTTT